MNGIYDATYSLLRNGLDISLTRQKALSGNIANLDTPGYVPRDVDFAQALDAATQSQATGMSRPTIEVIERPDKAASADGNAVDLDMQMARLSQNATFYSASTRGMNRKLAMLRYAASEGGA